MPLGRMEMREMPRGINVMHPVEKSIFENE
jgi:hypothetical protein